MHPHPIPCLKQCLANRLNACTLQLIRIGNSNDRFENLHKHYIMKILPVTCGSKRNCYIANGLLPSINFSNKNNFIPYFRVYLNCPDLMNNIHFHLSVGIAMISIIDSLSEGFVIEWIIQSQRKDLIKCLKNLSFEVRRINLSCDCIKNVLNI